MGILLSWINKSSKFYCLVVGKHFNRSFLKFVIAFFVYEIVDVMIRIKYKNAN